MQLSKFFDGKTSRGLYIGFCLNYIIIKFSGPFDGN